LSLVQATVHFSEADTPDAIKAAIGGRIQALANVHTGFGTRLLDRAIRTQLHGKVRFDWRVEGLTCEIEVETNVL
jgi:two-component sensor histidine kinase